MHRAARLASDLRRRYALPCPVTTADLLCLCQELGITVIRSMTLTGPGYFLRVPDPLIILRWNAGPETLAHELYHALSTEEIGTVYACTGAPGSAAEEEAAAFARRLCGE